MSDKKKTPIAIKGEREHRLNLSNPEDHDRIAQLGKALSSPVRVKMLNLLSQQTLSVQEIAGALAIPVSSAAFHLQVLEDANLVVTESQPGLRGSMRVCVCSMQLVQVINTFSQLPNQLPDRPLTVDMPIGNYHSCEVQPTCGLANRGGIIGNYDTPASFFAPERTEAQLIWFMQGYIEYRFPNLCVPEFTPQELSFVLEICSEAPGYKEDWPSDITFIVNGQEACTYRSPGDFGARRGVYTPSVWRSPQTQYGLLTSVSIREKGVYINDILTNPDLTLIDLNLPAQPYISLNLTIKPDAEYVGGLNLFGEGFGDHPQGIVMRLIY